MDLPMTKARAQQLASALKENFGQRMEAALADTPFPVALAYAIACKETGPFLVEFMENMEPPEALARCVFDASGDAKGTSRKAFPIDTAAFRSKYGDDFTEMLIEEANKSRSLRGLDGARWVYKGYGLFQYDLQHVRKDEAFFRQRLWGEFDECLQRLVVELQRKFAATGDVLAAVQAYNGSGPKAVIYRSHVEQLMLFCEEVV
jgi:hypothetical protein